METLDLATSIILLGILIVVFLILREPNCWYWKINRNIDFTGRTEPIIKKTTTTI